MYTPFHVDLDDFFKVNVLVYLCSIVKPFHLSLRKGVYLLTSSLFSKKWLMRLWGNKFSWLSVVLMRYFHLYFCIYVSKYLSLIMIKCMLYSDSRLLIKEMDSEILTICVLMRWQALPSIRLAYEPSCLCFSENLITILTLCLLYNHHSVTTNNVYDAVFFRLSSLYLC